MSTDTLTRQMHESRARRLIDAETRAAAAEAIRKDLEERLVDAEARASAAEDRARDIDIPGILPDRLYTVGTEIPSGEDGVMAVIDISYGTVYLRHQYDSNLWRKLELGGERMWTETPALLSEGGPFLPVAQDAGGLITCAARYDAIDRALRGLAHRIEQPDSPWRREVDHTNVIEWATERIRHADEALRWAEGKVRSLTDEVEHWRSRAWEAEDEVRSLTRSGTS